MSIPTQDWPKSFLLQVYKDAVEHGAIFVHPISEADATSFAARFYRLRRRSDKSTASFIPPEFHLVTCGRWVEADGGKLPIVYNKLPSGQSLPTITPMAPEDLVELASVEPIPSLPTSEPLQLSIGPEALQMGEEELTSFVERMKKRVQK